MGVLNDYANAAAVNAALNKGVEANKAVSELKGDLSDLQIIVGGDARLEYESVNTMIGIDGSTKTSTSSIKFYKVIDLRNSKQLKVVIEIAGGGTYDTHWFNQIDSSGNVISYAPINMGSAHTEIVVDLLDDTTAIIISMNKANGEFKLYAPIENKVAKNTQDIATNSQNIAINTAEIENLKRETIGGTLIYSPTQTSQMYNSSGDIKSPTSDYTFYEISELNGATSLEITYETTGKFDTHWWNEFDSEGNLIYYATKFSLNKKKLEVTLQPTTKSVKFLMWNDMGEFNCIHTFQSNIVKKSDIASGYTKLSAIGDSITYGYCKKDGVDSRVTSTYQRLIAERLGADYQNLGVSSTPICPNSDYTQEQNANAFVYRYAKIASDADLILVCGGTNDFRHLVPIGAVTDTSEKYEETFYGAVDYLINNIMLEHPTARLVFVSPFHQENDTTTKTTLDGETVHLSDYITALRTKCEQYGVLFINAFAESGVSLRSDFVTRYMPDRLHPNDDGHVIIYKNLIHYFATL